MRALEYGSVVLHGAIQRVLCFQPFNRLCLPADPLDRRCRRVESIDDFCFLLERPSDMTGANERWLVCKLRISKSRAAKSNEINRSHDCKTGELGMVCMMCSPHHDDRENSNEK